MSGSPSSAAPRWRTLAGLGAVVLALHLVLLNGGLPDFGVSGHSVAPAAASALRPAAMPDDTAPVASSRDRPSPVHVSQVRWIVPAPAPVIAPAPPAPVRPAPPPRPPVVAAVKPAPPAAPPPEPPVATTEAAAPPPPMTEEIPPPDAATEAVAADPQHAVAQAQPGDSDSASTPAASEAPPAETAQAPAETAPPLPPAQPPPSARLLYTVAGLFRGNPYHASGTLDWERGADRYSARMEMRMFLLGSRVQTSTGQVGPGGLMPERFADKARSERAAHFERGEHRRIRFSSNAPDAGLEPGAQDRLSLFLQIAGLLQARPEAYAAGQVIDMQVAGTSDAEIWRFQVGEETTLALPAGELRVRHLVRQPRKAYDSTVEMWLAPDLNHLPVRLRVTQSNGDMADQQLSQMP